jgi:hypothetical protein
MSTLVTATVKSNSSSPPAFQNSSGTQIGTLCRAWVSFNGTGTVAINAQFNVSSITDRGAGQYAINFTTALVDANYVLSGSAMYPTANSCHVITFGDYNGAVGTIPTASSCNMNTIYNLSSPQDCTYVTCAIFR